jgi:hypothetical protein
MTVSFKPVHVFAIKTLLDYCCQEKDDVLSSFSIADIQGLVNGPTFQY